MYRLFTVMFVLGIMFCAAPRAVAQDKPWDKILQKQKQENKQWEDAAEEKQKELISEGRKYMKDKRWDKAAEAFESARSIRYTRWKIRRGRRVVTEEGERKTFDLPATQKVRVRLDTRNTSRANDLLETVSEKRKEAWASDMKSRARELEREDDLPAAYETYVKLATADLPYKVQQKYQKDAAEKAREILEQAHDALDELAEAVDAENYEKAPDLVRNWIEKYAALKDEAGLAGKYYRIMNQPEVASIQRNIQARREMEKAVAHLEAEEYAKAYQLLQHIDEVYYDTEVGKQAAEKLAELRRNPNLRTKVIAKRAERICRKKLMLGDNYAANGLIEMAIEEYRYVVNNYPETEYADQAAEAIAELQDEQQENGEDDGEGD